MLREGGSIGLVNVTWKVQEDPDNDLLDQSGVLTFDPAQTEADLVLRVWDDGIPELEETFIVSLTEVSRVSFNINVLPTKILAFVTLLTEMTVKGYNKPHE